MINVIASIIDCDKRREDFISEILQLSSFFMFSTSSGFHQYGKRFPDAGDPWYGRRLVSRSNYKEIQKKNQCYSYVYRYGITLPYNT
ncbi:hypothetical protein NPIL_447461 [Nephila pilipes]|uniref:Uncharacterized protein n=1 Tax=Nephila pilipes TaxID=299642 RepID=A0A8X6QZX3_NEPPI|nr:hypothetical protein NPIL_447461 [Nephila pilipes]